MKEIESEGKTVQEAIDKGLKKLGVSRDDVDVKILSEGKTGLFGLMGASPALVPWIAKDMNTLMISVGGLAVAMILLGVIGGFIGKKS